MDFDLDEDGGTLREELMKLRLLLGAFLGRVVGKSGINVKFRDDEAPVMARLRIVQLSSKGRMVVPTAAVRYY